MRLRGATRPEISTRPPDPAAARRPHDLHERPDAEQPLHRVARPQHAVAGEAGADRVVRAAGAAWPRSCRRRRWSPRPSSPSGRRCAAGRRTGRPASGSPAAPSTRPATSASSPYSTLEGVSPSVVVVAVDRGRHVAHQLAAAPAAGRRASRPGTPSRRCPGGRRPCGTRTWVPAGYLLLEPPVLVSTTEPCVEVPCSGSFQRIRRAIASSASGVCCTLECVPRLAIPVLWAL